MSGIVIASVNGAVGIEAAVETLRSGGTALDAVLAGTRLVEANPDDHTVGYSGLPNMLGEVELDATSWTETASGRVAWARFSGIRMRRTWRAM